MKKQVIVVVHGVGVKQAGVSSDLLAAALQADPEPGTELPRMPPHSSDDFLMQEQRRYDIDAKASTFPARLRRYRSYDSDGRVTSERVIADFFWGDITAFGNGVIATIIAYMKVVLGLCHAIRENATDIFPTKSPLDRFGRTCATGAALTIHGPIIAINLVLLGGLLLSVGIDHAATGKVNFENHLEFKIAAIAITSAGVGIFLLWRGGSFLLRHLASWIAITGLLFLIAGFPELADYPLTALDDRFKHASCSAFSEQKAGQCSDAYRGILLVGLRLIAMMFVCWSLVCFLFLGVLLASGVNAGHGRRSPTTNIAAPAIVLISVLWFLLIAAVWATIFSLPWLNLPGTILSAALFAIMPAVACVAALAIAGLWVHFSKKLAKFDPPESYLSQPDANGERYRLIISHPMLMILYATSAAIFTMLLVDYFPDFLAPLAKAIKAILAWGTLSLIAALGFVGGFVLFNMRASFVAGLGILADVLAYLNDKSWNSGQTPANRTWLEKLLRFPKRKPSAANPQGYWQRERIKDRLDVLVTSLLRDEKPDRLDIVAHSQGTVIAIDLIKREGAEWLSTMQERHTAPAIRLVTMGSPYRHIYQHYFPSSFQPIDSKSAMAKRGPETGGVLSEWINIFRTDDFVGTHIGTGTWPEEHPVPANGHTMYWVDRHVIERLQEFLNLHEVRKHLQQDGSHPHKSE